MAVGTPVTTTRTQNVQIIKAMAVIKRPRDGALLVSEDANPAGALFHRPLGGHVEYGEYALETIHREFLEEIGQRLTHVRLLGVLENIFQWNGAAATRGRLHVRR